MIKTIFAGLIVSSVVAYIIYSLIMYPLLRMAVFYAGGGCVLIFALVWAFSHIESLFKNKLN